jgi:hypothetical protein
MFRRSPSTAAATDTDPGRGDRRRTRQDRRARQRRALDDAALQARLARVHRRLAEVGSVDVTGRGHAIDNEAARRDPMTRPFAAPTGARAPRRRTDTAAMARPA